MTSHPGSGGLVGILGMILNLILLSDLPGFLRMHYGYNDNRYAKQIHERQHKIQPGLSPSRLRPLCSVQHHSRTKHRQTIHQFILSITYSYNMTDPHQRSFARSLSSIHISSSRNGNDGNDQQCTKKIFNRRSSVDALRSTTVMMVPPPVHHRRRASTLSREVSSATSLSRSSSPVLVSKLRQSSPPKYSSTLHSPKLHLYQLYDENIIIDLPFPQPGERSFGRTSAVPVPPPAVVPRGPPCKRHSMMESTKEVLDNDYQHNKVKLATPRRPRRHSLVDMKEISRREYTLGEAARSPHHMTIPSTQQEAVDSTTALKNGDFCFVNRSDGSWTYAIVSSKSEECIVFGMCDAGYTKMIKKSHWGYLVRRVSMEVLLENEKRNGNGNDHDVAVDAPRSVPIEASKQHQVPTISFVNSCDDDDCSSLSSASVL